MPLDRLKSRVAAEILKDQGAPKKLSPDEQCAGTDMDDVDRSSFPDIADITDATTPANRGDSERVSSGLKRKTGQLGTT